jgi:hypothetical protein
LGKVSIMRESNDKLIVVLGMHRSGTSVITRALQVLGVNLGDTLYSATEGVNDKGFWEDIDLHSLDVEMLAALGSDWHHLSPISHGDVGVLRNKGYFLRAVELLRQKMSAEHIFGFKDPRIAKLLPFWKEVFNYCQFDVSYILTVRHPTSVVKSLAKRDSFDADKSYLLWLGHIITSMVDSTDGKRVIVDYDRLMRSPENELARIAKATDLEIDPAELQSYKTEFIDQKLRHTVYDLNDLSLDSACPPLVREIYAELLDVASDKIQIDDIALQRNVELWAGEFERLKSALVLVDKLCTQKAELDEEIAELDEEIAKRDGQITSINQALAERDAYIQRLISSKSWLITKPLRWVEEILLGDSSAAIDSIKRSIRLNKPVANLPPASLNEHQNTDSNTDPITALPIEPPENRFDRESKTQGKHV